MPCSFHYIDGVDLRAGYQGSGLISMGFELKDAMRKKILDNLLEVSSYCRPPHR